MSNRLLRARTSIFSPKRIKNRQITKRYKDRILGLRTINSRRNINVHKRRTDASDET